MSAPSNRLLNDPDVLAFALVLALASPEARKEIITALHLACEKAALPIAGRAS